MVRSFETLDSASLDAPCANVLIRPNSLAIVEMPIVAATPQPVRMNPRREITAIPGTASFVDPSGGSFVGERFYLNDAPRSLSEHARQRAGRCAARAMSPTLQQHAGSLLIFHNGSKRQRTERRSIADDSRTGPTRRSGAELRSLRRA